jgi:chemotaxis protein MotB
VKHRRRASDHVNHERWLVSYADFVTLLFAFFVVLFASAQMDQRKAARLSVAIDSGFQELAAFGNSRVSAALPAGKTMTSGPADSTATNLSRTSHEIRGLQENRAVEKDYARLRAELEEALAAEIKRNELALRMQPDGLVVSLREIGFFDSGSAVIKPKAHDAFARITSVLSKYSCALRIEGHTDDVPIHSSSFDSNWELSTARATDVIKTLIEDYGFPPARLSAAGYGEYRPIAANNSRQGRQSNRRVDIVVLPGPGSNFVTNPSVQ